VNVALTFHASVPVAVETGAPPMRHSADLARTVALCPCLEIIGEAAMDFAYSAKVEPLRAQLGAFMNRHVVPRLAD
jgi:hypothetical protein